MKETEKKYTVEEERWNVITHATGILLGVLVGTFFIYKAIESGGDAIAVFSLFLYLFGVLGSYVFSTFYHATSPENEKRRALLRKFDHAAIYWHIAGSYSPITLIAMRDTGYWGWGIFIFCWLCAIVGTSLSMYKLKKHNGLETVCYVLMGMTIVVAMKQFYDAVPLPVFVWVVCEGVAYITGAVFYSTYKIKYMHTVFHFFVLLGTICHMMAVWRIVEMIK